MVYLCAAINQSKTHFRTHLGPKIAVNDGK